MKVALAIVSLFREGGLQRDCMAIARLLAAQGHQVTILTSRVEGEVDDELAVELLPVRAWTNHGRNVAFSRELQRRAAGRFDRVVGFDKLEGLDVLYCADPPDAPRYEKGFARFLPRGRKLTALEQACFAPEAATRLLLLSQPQLEAYRNAWKTPPARLTLLPPTINAQRRKPQLRTDGTRKFLREEMAVGEQSMLWLAVGNQPQVKGFDRSLQALEVFSDARLIVAGIGHNSKAGRKLWRMAGRLGVRDRIRLLGMREDIPELMAAADLLVHPARTETTGTVILEALVNGLPVVASGACGYAGHIVRADAGLVVPEPFSQATFLERLRQAQTSDRLQRWSDNAVHYGETADLYHGLSQTASVIIGRT